MITVLCVRFGTRYGREYVERLRNMVSRHLTIPYEFVCLTDDSTPIEDVRLVVQPNAGYARGWWHKVHMFDPSLPIKGRILYFDLDVVVVNNLNLLTQNLGNNFYGILDFNRKFHKTYRSLNSSMLSWVHGSQNKLYENFRKDPKAAQRLHGDQDWIWRHCSSEIKFWPQEYIQSYKWEIRSREDLEIKHGQRNFKHINNNVIVPEICCVLVFHGEPKPQDVQDKIVVDNWK
jgi:hypothetical protein